LSRQYRLSSGVWHLAFDMGTRADSLVILRYIQLFLFGICTLRSIFVIAPRWHCHRQVNRPSPSLFQGMRTSSQHHFPASQVSQSLHVAPIPIPGQTRPAIPKPRLRKRLQRIGVFFMAAPFLVPVETLHVTEVVDRCPSVAGPKTVLLTVLGGVRGPGELVENLRVGPELLPRDGAGGAVCGQARPRRRPPQPLRRRPGGSSPEGAAEGGQDGWPG
jgi:hypothetical protein